MTSYTTLITSAGTANSPERDGCPSVHTVEGREEVFVVVRDDVGEDVRRALADEFNAEREILGSQPPWVPCGLMTLPTLGAFRRAHMHRRGDFRGRLEQLPTYDRDETEFQAWLAGRPATPAKQEWLDEMQADLDRGLSYWRVRILSEDLTDYELYACQRGYAINTDFEGIRVLRRGEHHIPDLVGPVDYHVFGRAGEHAEDGPVVPVVYHHDGTFGGGGYLGGGDPRARAYRDELHRLWDIAEPWDTWWARHPELHDARPARAA